MNTLLDCAQAAAIAAGQHALRNRQRRQRDARLFEHDVKLELDRECQTVAEQVIRQRYPHHAFLGEEDTHHTSTDAEMRWIIDPIDGTVNFFHGLPIWCSSVAVQRRGQTLAGAVFAPQLDCCYTARVGRRARCNGRVIRVSETARLDQAMIATGIAKARELHAQSLQNFTKMTAKARKTRIMGSAALDICHVACGQIDAFYENGIFLWDIAAGALIVQQAGGMGEILHSGPGQRMTFMATNGKLHRAMRRLFDK